MVPYKLSIQDGSDLDSCRLYSLVGGAEDLDIQHILGMISRDPGRLSTGGKVGLDYRIWSSCVGHEVGSCMLSTRGKRSEGPYKLSSQDKHVPDLHRLCSLIGDV